MKKVIKRMLLGSELCCEVTCLDEGIAVLFVGGDKSHIGSISIAEENGSVSTIVFPDHKDRVIGERWAQELRTKYRCRVVVVCGVHFDHASQKDISSIVGVSENMLSEFLAESGKLSDDSDTVQEGKRGRYFEK